MVLVLVLLPPLAGALGGSAPARRQAATSAGRSAMTLARGRGVRRADAAWSAGALFPWLLWQVDAAPARASCSRCACRGRGGQHRLRLGAAVRRVVRARRVLRRHGAARVGVQPPRGRGDAAAARRLRGAVLRLGRHAVRPARCWSSEPLQRAGGGGDHRGRQVARGGAAGAAVALSAEHRAHGVGEPGADRRVLVHPRRRSACRSGCCRRRAEPDPGRRADLDRAQSAVCSAADRAAAALDARALRRWRAQLDAARRPAGRAADDRPTRSTCRSQVVLVGYGRVGRRIAAGADGAPASRSSSPRRTASSSSSCAPRACRRCSAMRPIPRR